PVHLFREPGEAEAYRRYLEGWVAQLHGKLVERPAGSWPEPEAAWRTIAEHAVWRLNLISMYATASPLKRLLVQRAALLEKGLRDLFGQELDHTFPPAPARRRLRLGVLAQHFGPQTETYGLLGFYGHLDRDRFEVVLIANRESSGGVAERCAAAADRVVHLSGDIPAKVRQIRDLDLDLLLLGTNVSICTHDITLLALYRLARWQVATNVGVATTGMRTWDRFLEVVDHDPAFGDRNCSEELLCLGLPCSMADVGDLETLPVARYTRAQLALPEEAVVYASAASPYKLPPEVVETWAEVLAAVPGSYLLLCPFNPNWSDRYPEGPFVSMVERTLERHGVGPERLRIAAVSGSERVRGLFALADVMLDSYVCASGVTLLDVLATGIVPVMFHGPTLRTQTASVTLGRGHFPELFAEGVAEYREIAVRLGLDPGWRRALRARLLEHRRWVASGALYRQVGAALGEALERLARGAPVAA
ncbi:MAG: hypothetical protein D6739_10265, partial [Nitrospirae bacterium]